MNRNRFLRCAAVFLPSALLSGGFASAETEGERLFKMNEPAQAAPLLEREVAGGTVSADSYNFLGLAYFQLGEYEKSMDAFERGMKSPRSDKKRLCFNKGNVAYSRGDYAYAEKCYSLALAAAPDFYVALLNRANSRLAQGNYAAAIADYQGYLAAVPSDSQLDGISRLISSLEAEQERIAAEERRLAAENARMQEELARQEQARRAAEEERRRKLLEEVANSLQQADTASMTAGAEDVMGYDYESELD